MKRMITSSTEASQERRSTIVIPKLIVLTVSSPLDNITVEGATLTGAQFNQLREKFRLDVVDILENEYNFVVLEEKYKGKMQKGHPSKNAGSLSIYMSVIYNICNLWPDSESKDTINCRIEVRTADHPTYNPEYVARDYVQDRMTEVPNPSDIRVDHTFKEQEELIIDDHDPRKEYQESLAELRQRVEELFRSWRIRYKSLRR